MGARGSAVDTGNHKPAPDSKKNNRDDCQHDEDVEFCAIDDELVLVGRLLREEEEQNGDGKGNQSNRDHAHAGGKEVTGPLDLGVGGTRERFRLLFGDIAMDQMTATGTHISDFGVLPDFFGEGIRRGLLFDFGLIDFFGAMGAIHRLPPYSSSIKTRSALLRSKIWIFKTPLELTWVPKTPET